MDQFQDQFEAHLHALGRDARAAANFIYTELTLHFLFGGESDLFERVNTHAGFWNITLAGLQTSGFMALGRMYDRDDGTHSIRALLTIVETYPGLFQPSSLEQRRIGSGGSNDSAKEFATGSHQLQSSDLAPIRKEFDELRSLYGKKVEPIRHKALAHSARLPGEERRKLFTGVFTRDIQRIAVFPLRLERALFGLYMSGQAPNLENPTTNVVEILNNLPSHATSTWEHMHAAKDAAEFVAWMMSAPAPEERIDPEVIAKLVRATELGAVGLFESDFDEDK